MLFCVALTVSILFFNVRSAHGVEYVLNHEAAGKFVHVAGSACCNLHANPRPVFQGVPGCEKRCLQQEDCDAFVFVNPETERLCFLVRFTTRGPNGTMTSGAMRPKKDRIFGLVRGSLQATSQAEHTNETVDMNAKADEQRIVIPKQLILRVLKQQIVTPKEISAVIAAGDAFSALQSLQMSSGELSIAPFFLTFALIVSASVAYLFLGTAAQRNTSTRERKSKSQVLTGSTRRFSMFEMPATSCVSSGEKDADDASLACQAKNVDEPTEQGRWVWLEPSAWLVRRDLPAELLMSPGILPAEMLAEAGG